MSYAAVHLTQLCQNVKSVATIFVNRQSFFIWHHVAHSICMLMSTALIIIADFIFEKRDPVQDRSNQRKHSETRYMSTNINTGCKNITTAHIWPEYCTAVKRGPQTNRGKVFGDFPDTACIQHADHHLKRKQIKRINFVFRDCGANRHLLNKIQKQQDVFVRACYKTEKPTIKNIGE